jgi:hypothetical protein
MYLRNDGSGNALTVDDGSSGNTVFVIDSSGNVGIGTSSPSFGIELSGSGNSSYLRTVRTGGKTGTFGSDASSAFVEAVGNTPFTFYTNAAERMRIDSSGYMHIGDTVLAYLSSTKATSILPGTIYTRRETTAARGHLEFYNPNGAVGSITTTNSSTAYNTSSDYRLKENVNYDFDATTRLKELKPARFNFIANPDTTVDGFLAHEVSSIVPEAITGEKDAVDENGNPKYQGIDQSKLVPLLVKTIQELEARITTLEANNP